MPDKAAHTQIIRQRSFADPTAERSDIDLGIVVPRSTFNSMSGNVQVAECLNVQQVWESISYVQPIPVQT